LNAVMLRSLPVEDPHQLVQLLSRQNAINGTYTNPIWEQVRDHQQAFSGVLAYSSQRFDLANGGESRFANGIWVSGDFFRVLEPRWQHTPEYASDFKICSNDSDFFELAAAYFHFPLLFCSGAGCFSLLGGTIPFKRR
jgi:hypothetical protein